MPFIAVAQQASAPETNPVSNAVRFSVERASKNMVAAADEMPADKYGFHPTPAQMTSGNWLRTWWLQLRPVLENFRHSGAHGGEAERDGCERETGEFAEGFV